MKKTIRLNAGMILAAMTLTAGMLAAQAVDPAAQAAKPPDAERPPLPRFLEVTPLIGTGGQPSEAGLRQLSEKGYKSIINIRSAEEMTAFPWEEKLAVELGFKYFNVPLRGRELTEAQALAFLNLMKALQDEKVFVHCAAANRVGGLMMVHRVLQEGMTVEKAEEEANRIGLTSDAIRKFARGVIEKQQKR